MGYFTKGGKLTMDRTDILLAALVVIVTASVVRAEVRHHRLMRLLNDFATMVGELFDVLGDQ
jgi:hypothetical protein